jgi:hypothetical protein
MSLYIKKLMEEVAREEAANKPKTSSLRRCLETWHLRLPSVARLCYGRN